MTTTPHTGTIPPDGFATAPCYSSLAGDPDLAELLALFVGELPQREPRGLALIANELAERTAGGAPRHRHLIRLETGRPSTPLLRGGFPCELFLYSRLT